MSTRAPLTLTRYYAGETMTLRLARRDVVEIVGRGGADDDLKRRIALVVTELATNAVEAAPWRPYLVTVAVTDGVVDLRVRNHCDGDGPPPRDAWRTPDAAAPRGRGLAIVDASADEVNVERPSEATVEITARFTLD